MNTFQVILATNGSWTFAGFLYEDIQWASSSTLIGFNAGDLERFYTLSDFLSVDDILNLETGSNVDIPGTYIFRVDSSEVIFPSVGTYHKSLVERGSEYVYEGTVCNAHKSNV